MNLLGIGNLAFLGIPLSFSTQGKCAMLEKVFQSRVSLLILL